MMRFRRCLTLALAAVAALVLPASGFGQGTTVKLGLLTPLSPPGDPGAGQLIARGAALGVEYVNSVRGGVLGSACGQPARRVELVTEDDAGTPEKGLAGFRKLATRDGVAAVIGQFHSSVMLAVQPLADELKVPFFSTQASAAAITANHPAYSFRTHAIDPDRARAWMDFIVRSGFKKVAMIAENTDYGVGLVEETRKLAAQGGRVQLEPVIFDRGTTDFTPLLLKARAWQPDLVINVGVGSPAYLITKQAHDIGLFPAVPMLGSYDFPIRPEFWQNLGPAGVYFAFISYYHPQMPLTDLGRWFAQAYEARFKEPPVYSAFNAFGQIAIIAQAIDAACAADGPSLVRVLETREFTNWNGTARFPRGEGPYWHQASPPLVILQYTAAGQTYDKATILWPPAMATGTLARP